MSNTIRWGIIGTGLIADMFVTDLLENGHTVTAVGSRSQESADAFASKFGIAHAHATYEDLVADDEVDAVYVATPHPMHADNATLALVAGKHVLIEKPFTLNASEADQVVTLAEDEELVVLEAMWSRFLPHMARIREIIAAGTIGEVRTVIADHNQSLPQNPEHRLQNPDLGGGALLDLGIYPVSFAWDILGEPTGIVATAAKTATGVDEQTAIILSYSNGQQALLHTALNTPGPTAASIIGTKGWIGIDGDFYAPTTFTVHGLEGEIIERFDGAVPSRGMQFEAAELERLVAEGATAGELLPPRQTVGIMRTLDEVRRQIDLRYPGE